MDQEITSWSANGIKHSGNLLSEKNGFKIIDCEACGFVHAIPIPAAEELDDYYKKQFYGSQKPDYAAQHLRDIEWWKMGHFDRLRRFEKLLGGKGRLLDIGSGPGFFVASAMEAGWEAKGIEPSADACDYARGLGGDVIESPFSLDALDAEGKFDAIVINQAIEHIPNPQTIFNDVKRLLNDNGLFCVIAANDFNAIQTAATKVLGEEEWWVIPPEHLNYFSPESLSNLFRRQSFEVVSELSTFPIDAFLLMGDNYRKKPELGRVAHNRRVLFEKNLAEAGMSDLKDRMYKAFFDLGLGRVCEVIGQLGASK